jgi:hypothetical protein
MKKSVPGCIIMLLVSLTLISSECNCGKADVPSPSIVGSWDYESYSSLITDSTSAHSYTQTTFDTSFFPHTQNSYQFKVNDSVIYTDYTMNPNLIKYGTYHFIDSEFSGHIVLLFPPANADTLSYFTYNGLSFTKVIDSPHIYYQFTQNYTRY